MNSFIGVRRRFISAVLSVFGLHHANVVNSPIVQETQTVQTAPPDIAVQRISGDECHPIKHFGLRSNRHGVHASVGTESGEDRRSPNS